jgi:Secretion system C-terminal sorting domain
MKNLISILIMVMLAGSLSSQVKVHFSLVNPRIDQNVFAYDVRATVQSGQQWKVGPTNIRIAFSTIPDGALQVMEDNPAANANINISGNSNYANMTTTSIHNDSAISLNMLLLYQQSAYTLAPGTYTLGSVRWIVFNANACINYTILPISAVFDDATPLSYPSQWTKTDTGCVPIGINVQLTTEVPRNYMLYQNYPNPFNPSTRIRYDVPSTSNVKIVVYDALGKEVETMVDMELHPGTYEVTWNAGNYASGLYFYRIITDKYVHTNKMVLMK